MRPYILLLCIMILGCATTSGVMEAEGGTYLISAQAPPAHGGTAAANQAAYEDAKTFCASRGRRPVVLAAGERDVYQSGGAFTAGPHGAVGGFGTSAWGSINLRFRCE